MEIAREDLLYTLGQVSGGLAMGNKESREGAAFFMFKGGKVHSFNDEVYCSMPLDLGFEGAVLGKEFLSTVKKLRGELVKVEVKDNGEAVLKSGRRRVGFQINHDVAQDLADIQKVTNWVDCDPMTPAHIEDTCGCTSGKRDEKFYKTCLQLTPDYIQATDNLQFMRVWAVKAPVTEPVCVKGYTVKQVGGLDVVRWGTNSEWLGFETGDGLEYYARLYRDDAYPDLDFLAVEQEGDNFIAPQGFTEAVDAAMIFASELSDPTCKVSMDSDGKLTVESQGLTGWTKETLDSAYTGEALQFWASPKVLKQFSDTYVDGKISEAALSVYRENEFVYLSSIQR